MMVVGAIIIAAIVSIARAMGMNMLIIPFQIVLAVVATRMGD